MTNNYLTTTDWWGLSVSLTDYFSPCPFLPTAELLIVWSSSSSVAELFSAKVAINFFSSSYKEELIITGCQMDLSLKELRYLSPSMTLASKCTNAPKSWWNNKEARKPAKRILRHIPDLLQVDLTSFLASGASFRAKDFFENLVITRS